MEDGMKQIGIVLLGMSLVAGGAVYFNRVVRPGIAAQIMAATTPPPPTVPVADARLVHRPVRLAGIGSIVASHQVAVAAEVGGRVTGVFFDSGETVRAGMPLVQLNNAQDEADRSGFQAQIEVAALDLSRSSRLAQDQVAAVKTVDESRARFRQAAAGLARINATIAQKRIDAPFGGEIGLRQVEVGQYLNPGNPIAVLTDLDTLRVNFSLPERDRLRLKTGQAVEFTVDAFRGHDFAARVTAIDPQIGADTRTNRLQATVDNADHALLPGMFAEVSVIIDADAQVVAVPETAVDVSLAGEGVYVVAADPATPDRQAMYARRKAVTTGERFDGLVAIIDGISLGETVVSAGQSRLIPGFPIVPKPELPRLAQANH
jgi:multidrug efflux system membrane fusion protein